MKAERRLSSRRTVLLSVSFFSGIAMLLAAQGAIDGFLSHPAFLVREVEVQWPEGVKSRPRRFRLNPPTSIFRVDLKILGYAFQRRYPSVEVESIERVMPNRLVATMRPRRVVGQVNLGGSYYLVSDDGVVVAPASSVARPELPILLLDGFRGPLRVGSGLESPSFWKASELLATIHRDGGIAGHRVASIRVSGQDLFLLLDCGAEIRFSGDHLAVGWQHLVGLLRNRPELLKQANYLDLRFEDPVIGEKAKSREKAKRSRRA